MRIAIANDNPTNKMVLISIIEKQPGYDVAWTANDGAEAITKCQLDTPDLILMDMIMPVTNGVEACNVIMQNTPCAIIIVTASPTENSALIFKAMSYGALDVVQTPFSNASGSENCKDDLLRKINIASRLIESESKTKNGDFIEDGATEHSKKQLVVLGASTGGPGVLANILSKLPADFPVPVIIVQHVDSSFTESFSAWLNKQSELNVRIARKGDKPKRGTVLVAGEGDHLIMTPSGQLAYSEEPKELVYKPSVNVFFNSVAKYWDGTIIAALLTGMGDDGATGLANIHHLGGHTITQEKDSCAVYGMPKAADDLGVSMQSLVPDDIADSIISIIGEK